MSRKIRQEDEMTVEEIARNIEAYKELDKNLEEVMKNFWLKYTDTPVSYTGSVLHGSWNAKRSKAFDGLTFKASHEQMRDLCSGSCVVKEEDLIHQSELKLVKK